MTDEIERVRQLYIESVREVYGVPFAAHDERAIEAIAKRLQPKPTPAPKVWSVSAETVMRYFVEFWKKNDTKATLNAIVDDILRDRPDAVAKEYQRRYRAAFGVEASLKNLFPEVEG